MRKHGGRKLGLLLIMILLSGVITGCSDWFSRRTSANVESQDIILTFGYPRDPSGIMKKLTASFNESSTGLIIKPIEIGGNAQEYYRELMALLAADEKLPDIMLLHDTWMSHFAANGTIKPLDGGMPQSRQNSFFRGMINAGKMGDSIYFVPLWQDAPLLYYRTDLVEEPPATWEMLRQTAKNLTAGEGQPYGFIFPGSHQDNMSLFAGSFLSSYDAFPLLTGNSITFQEENMLTSLSMLHQMISDGVIPKEVLQLNAEGCRKLFEEGNALFMWNWSYAWRTYTEPGSPLADKVGIVALPYGIEDAASTAILSGWGMTVGKNTASILDAWRFIEMMTGAEAQMRLLEEGGLMPARKELYQQSSWMKDMRIPEVLNDIMEKSGALRTGEAFDAQIDNLSNAFAQLIGKGRPTGEIYTMLKTSLMEQPLGDVDGEEAAQ